jgi:hypothetical protein
MFNASFAAILDDIFDSVDYYVGSDQKRAVEQTIKTGGRKLSSNVSFHRMFVPSGNSRFNLLIRYIVGAIYNIWYLIFSNKSKVLIFNNNNPFSLVPITLFNFIVKRKVVIVSHGELEFIRSKNADLRMSGFYQLLGLMLRCGLKLSKRSGLIYFVVLGESLKKNLMSYGLIKEGQILVIDHPYLFKNQFDLETKILNKEHVIRIGTIGIFSEPKGSMALLTVSKNYLSEKKISFHVVGGISGSAIKFEDYPNVIFHSRERNFIDRTEYLSLVDALDFVVFFYPKTMYKLMASGAVFDAINLNKPVLALSNDYFDYLFDKHGKIGILCANIDQMMIEIDRLLSDESPDKYLFEGIARLKNHHSVESIARQLNSVFIEIDLF